MIVNFSLPRTVIYRAESRERFLVNTGHTRSILRPQSTGVIHTWISELCDGGSFHGQLMVDILVFFSAPVHFSWGESVSGDPITVSNEKESVSGSSKRSVSFIHPALSSGWCPLHLASQTRLTMRECVSARSAILG